MANFPRVKPSGWGLFDLLASALMNQLDIDHAASVNGDGGGTWGGAGTFTNWSLTGTSQVNSTGQVTTTNTVTGNVVHAVTDVTAAGDVIATDALKGYVAMAQRRQPSSVFAQTYDLATVNPGPLDFTANDVFFITLFDSTGASTIASMGGFTIGVCTNANTDREVKKGARITIYITTTQPAGAQTTDPAVWPASFVFASIADRSIELQPGQGSWYVMELEQVGTPAAPSFLVSVRRF